MSRIKNKGTMKIHFYLALCLSTLIAGLPASATNSRTPPASAQRPIKSAGAEAYQKLLPDLAAAHRKKLEGELAQLKQNSEKLSPQLAEARKKTGFDADAMMKEFSQVASATTVAGAMQRGAAFRAKYEPTMLTLSQGAGLDLQTERDRLFTFVNPGNTQVFTGPIGVGGSSEERRDEEPEPPREAPDVSTATFVAPYSSEGHVGEHANADAATGQLSLVNGLALAGSSQKLAFITQDLPVERGVKRVRVFVTLNPTSYGTHAFNLSGYSSAEAIVNLRLLEGSRIVASDRLSLSRSVAEFIGASDREGSRSVMLQCEFTRPAPYDETTYTLVAEIEGWAGTGGLGGATVNISTTLRQFQVYLHRS
jgi:hypothetical protein